MKFRNLVRAMMVVASIVGSASLMGCVEEKGPMEKMGESMDEAAEEVKDEYDDATT